MNNMNEELAFIGMLCDKIKMEAFDLQHIRVSDQQREKMMYLKQHLMTLSSGFHVAYDQIKAENRDYLPDVRPVQVQPEKLRTSAESLTRLRKFDGNESANQQIDFFDHEKD
jgi:hypothetical protein